PLDLVLARVAGDAEQLVVVPFSRRHAFLYGRAATPPRTPPRQDAKARTPPCARSGLPSRSPCAAGREDRPRRAGDSPARTARRRTRRRAARPPRRPGRRGRRAGADRAPR